MKIIRSKRKTLSLKVDDNWELIVKSPFHINIETINAFVLKHKSWIDDRKKQLVEWKKLYIEGELFYYMWEDYKLIFSQNEKKLRFDGNNFYLWLNQKANAKKLFLDFYKKHAKMYLIHRVEFISNKYWLIYNNLRISTAKTRWWSCSSAKNLSFSFKLIMAPSEVIDYVIVHELAHLKEMNHSKNFWDLVDIMMKWLYYDSYKNIKNWLKLNWTKLVF